MAPPDIKALIFDVFGTVVDWRSSIIEQSATFGKAGELNGTGEPSPTPGAASISLL